jgi:pyridoxamine 5'-phosphate oxidase family protein
MGFTSEEFAYLRSQHLGRIATTSAKGEPDVAPVTFDIADDGAISISGFDNPATIKWTNVLATGRAAFVVDDLASVNPWSPRGVKVKGAAEGVTTDDGRGIIVIRPETVWSWAINPEGGTHMGGRIGRRPFSEDVSA